MISNPFHVLTRISSHLLTMPTPPWRDRDLSPVPDLTPLGSPVIPHQQLAAAEAAVQSQRITRAAEARDSAEEKSGEKEAAKGNQAFRPEDYQRSPETELEEACREEELQLTDVSIEEIERKLEELDEFFESAPEEDEVRNGNGTEFLKSIIERLDALDEFFEGLEDQDDEPKSSE